MRATDPLDHPPSALGEVRAEVSRRLFAAHEQGRIRAVEVRGSSYFGADAGPDAYLGPRFVDPLLGTGATSVLGDPDLPYTMTAIPDFGRLLARAATDPEMLGRAWHVPSAPAVSVRDLARMVLRAAGREDEPRLRTMPASLLRVLGWFSPTLRAVRETLYQNTEPFVADDTDTRELLGETHTPLEETAADIVAARLNRL